MTVFPDTQAVTLQDPSRRPATRDTFLSQTPLALVAIVAVAAIVAVNAGDTGRPQQAAAASAAVVPASCADCGEIVSISPILAAEAAATGTQPGRVFEVRMSDGSVRVVRQPAGGFAVGDRIRVEGNALKRSN